MDYNLYWRTDSVPVTIAGKTFAAWSKMKEPHSVTLNPLFMNIKQDDYSFISLKNVRKIGFKLFDYSKVGYMVTKNGLRRL